MTLGELYEYIPKRKSVRDYLDDPPAEELIEELVDFLSEQDAVNAELDWDFDILPENEMFVLTRGNLPVKASRYLVLRSDKGLFYGQNMGYIGALASLWLCSRGLGTCWLGSVDIAEDFPDSLPYIITLAFGKTDSPYRGEGEEADRQPVSKFCKTPFEGNALAIAEAVRLAPSAMNRQHVRLMLGTDGDIEIFRKTSYTNLSADVEMSIDAGIAMAYVKVAGEALGCDVTLRGKKPAPMWGGRFYTASASLKPKASD